MSGLTATPGERAGPGVAFSSERHYLRNSICFVFSISARIFRRSFLDFPEITFLFSASLKPLRTFRIASSSICRRITLSVNTGSVISCFLAIKAVVLSFSRLHWAPANCGTTLRLIKASSGFLV